MYEEGVQQYLVAKRIAARRVLGRQGARAARFRPHELPSNGEIRRALLRVADLAEGPRRLRRLFAMRVVALETMIALARFSPRLIGSVASGHVRRGSDIDLHVFVPGDARARELDASPVIARLEALAWPHELRRVLIRKFGEFREFTHVDVDRGFRVELSVYPLADLRAVQRSSVDGRPIDRVSASRLRALLELDHAAAWSRYQATGELPDRDALLDEDAEPPGRYDGLLAEFDESAHTE